MGSVAHFGILFCLQGIYQVVLPFLRLRKYIIIVELNFLVSSFFFFHLADDDPSSFLIKKFAIAFTTIETVNVELNFANNERILFDFS